MCTAINEPADYDCVTFFTLAAGGLSWADANQTPKSITRPVFADLGIDLSTLQFKENGNVYSDLKEWSDSFFVASPKTDWVLIGSGPQSNADNLNIADNKALKNIANQHNWFYFDGYRPLINYQKLDSLNWEGDGVHLDHSTGFYLASMLWRIIGIDDYLKFSRMAGTDPTGDMNFTQTRGIKFTGSNLNNPTGRIAASTNSPDLYIYAQRWFGLVNVGGALLTHFDPNNGWIIDNLHNNRGYAFNVTNAPGLYFPNDTTFGFFLHRGNGTRGNLLVQDVSSLRSFFAPNTQQYATGDFTYLVKNGTTGRFEYLNSLIASTISPGDSSTSVATTAFVDKIKDSLLSTHESGWYIPTTIESPNFGNIASVTADSCYWQRIGNIVQVNVSFRVVTESASTLTGIQFTLPKASSLTSANDATGSAQWLPNNYSAINGVLSADIAADKIDIGFQTPSTISSNYSWKVVGQFSYIIKN